MYSNKEYKFVTRKYSNSFNKISLEIISTICTSLVLCKEEVAFSTGYSLIKILVLRCNVINDTETEFKNTYAMNRFDAPSKMVYWRQPEGQLLN